MIKVGIYGAAGYTAGELIRLLLTHPEVELTGLQSESQADKPIVSVHSDLQGDTDLAFVGELNPDDFDVAFLCKGHGESLKLLTSQPALEKKKIIDLSQDFRLNGDHNFIYGLPEKNLDLIKVSEHIANPGCFATSIQLALMPAVESRIVTGDVHISGITGSTGAGQAFSKTSHFSWRHGNASVYKAFTHQHLNEIGETFKRINSDFDWALNFIPYRGAFSRGIITTSYFKSNGRSEKELVGIYQKAYSKHPFTHVTEENPDLKMVVNSNKCLVYPKVIGEQVMVISVIDNLLKGASGQAVQNMNLMFGLDETTGLKLKTSAF